jgi:prepilin-type processing-associated H-X9-DG protein
MCEKSVSNRHRKQGAFGRGELIITIAVVFILIILGAIFIRKSKGGSTSNVCLSNLKLLGTGITMYTQANAQKLPYAFIHVSNTKQSVWDNLVGSYVQAAVQSEGSASATGAGRLLQCPEDKVPPLEFAAKNGLPRRTYALPWHTMDRLNWPPAATNATGVGLWWASYGQGNTAVSNLTSFLAGGLPAIRMDMISDAAQTMLLTEQAKSNNIAGNSSGARIRYTAEHLEEGVVNPAEYHSGKIQYLMVDGHVETLLPEETVGPKGKPGKVWNTHFGIWSIKPND